MILIPQIINTMPEIICELFRKYSIINILTNKRISPNNIITHRIIPQIINEYIINIPNKPIRIPIISSKLNFSDICIVVSFKYNINGNSFFYVALTSKGLAK